MSRLNLSETPDNDYEAFGNLDELIPNYAINKQELDSYKKICDAANARIKELMLAAGENEHESNGWIAKRTVVEKESMDEGKLLSVIKKYGIEGIIKTREYVDMDALESYLYHHDDIASFTTDLAKCKEVKKEVRLTVKRIKKKKEDD